MRHRHFMFVAALSFLLGTRALTGAPSLDLRTNDVVAWIGGSDVASAQFTGHFETFVALQSAARVRNLGWEGDTVFAQPRDVNFPGIGEQVERIGATVVLLQFGRTEALNGRAAVSRFYTDYERLASNCLRRVARVVLVTPAPFEKPAGMLPDLSARNPLLAEHVEAIRRLGGAHRWAVVDVFGELNGASDHSRRLTSDGLNLTAWGQAQFAAALARGLGGAEAVRLAGDVEANGAFANHELEKLRQLVLEKDRLWFNYWRPQNWAFLGGDRITQPSSRDHRDPSIRWMPAEMEKYLPLIRAQESAIERDVKIMRKD